MPATPIPAIPFRRVEPGSTTASLPIESGRSPHDYEFVVAVVPRRTSLHTLRAALTSEAERGRWELARTCLYYGGGKQVWLRRRIIRVRSTLASTEVA